MQHPPLKTRDRLIVTAMQMFWEKGYGSTSIADVLHAAGVNSGSLYHFFPGKQDLLLAVLDAYLHGIDEMLLAPAWKDVTDPIQKVYALLAQYRRSIVETECVYGCPIGSLALEIHEPDPVVQSALSANFDAWVGAIERCFAEAGPRLPKRIDRRALAEFVLTTMEGGVMQSRAHRDVRYFDRSVRQLRIYVELLEKEAATPPLPRRKREAR